MNEKEFNTHCANVMGWNLKEVPIAFGKMSFWMNSNDNMMHPVYKWKPYDDLNQMAEVFDKKIAEINLVMPVDRHVAMMKFNQDLIDGKGIKQAMRSFITSTTGVENDNKN